MLAWYKALASSDYDSNIVNDSYVCTQMLP